MSSTVRAKFNTVALDEERKQLRLVDVNVYSNREPKFVTKEELKLYHKGVLQNSEIDEERQRASDIEAFIAADEYINLSRITSAQLRKTSEAFKQEYPGIKILHLLDCGFDDQDCFRFIDKELEDEFIVRMKLSRNSQEVYTDEKNKQRYIKLIDSRFANNKSFPIGKLTIKRKCYQNASCFIEYDNCTIEEHTYMGVRVLLLSRLGQRIFKEPMLILSNRQIKTAEQAHGIYFTYLLRSKIEGVFKFLKDVLGWEEFQVQDFESIKNIVALCFFIGGYFYEIESELIKDVTFQFICDLGGGNGKYTRYYFLQGLSKVLTYNAVEKFVEDQGLSYEQFEQMRNVLRC